MNFTAPVVTPGGILALVVLVLAVVFLAVGQADIKTMGLIAVLALARLLP